MTLEKDHRCQPWRSRLDDFVDGRLSPGRRAELERHLDGCASCRAEVEDVERLLAAAHDLPRSLEPPRDLWPGVEARLARHRRRPRLRGWIPQAVAATLLIAFGAVAGRVLWPPAAATRIVEVPIVEQAGAVELARAEAEYLRVKESLWISILHHSDDLSPMTVSVVEDNLRTIDKAIDEIHQALEQDPGNPLLESHLFANHRRGIGLLRRLAAASSEI